VSRKQRGPYGFSISRKNMCVFLRIKITN